jgi:hypothetical protein
MKAIPRPEIHRQWTRSLPASLRPEEIRRLHDLSRQSGRPIRRLVTDAVLAALEDAREAQFQAA